MIWIVRRKKFCFVYEIFGVKINFVLKRWRVLLLWKDIENKFLNRFYGFLMEGKIIKVNNELVIFLFLFFNFLMENNYK